ncbi:hypothetical protein ES703_86977 [subsurface metagenome]
MLPQQGTVATAHREGLDDANPHSCCHHRGSGQRRLCFALQDCQWRPLWARPASDLADARDPVGDASPGRCGHGAGRLRVPLAGRHTINRRPEHRFQRCQLGLVGWRTTPGQGDETRRSDQKQCPDLCQSGESPERQRSPGCAGACGGQPGQHKLPFGPAQRPRYPCRTLFCHDPAGPQPGPGTVGSQGGGAGWLGQEGDHLGQSQQHPVSRCLPRRDRRRARAPGHQG